VGGQLLGHGLGQHGHAGLADAVVGVLGHEPVVQRGDEQDGAGGPWVSLGDAPPLGDQRLHQPVGEQPRPLQVGRQHLAELAGPDVQHALPGGDPDVVDHELDRPVGRQLVGQLGDAVVADVPGQEPAGLGGEGAGQRVVVLVHDHHLGTGHDQPFGDRLTDPAGRAGHHGAPSSQVLGQRQGNRARVGGSAPQISVAIQLDRVPQCLAVHPTDLQYCLLLVPARIIVASRAPAS
jgi:hypothetical protein